MSDLMMNYVGQIGLFLVLFSGVLFVVFGQTTMRKLRKKSETKDSLGIELFSGSNSFGVSIMLSIPRLWARRIDKNNNKHGGGITANSEVLYENTSKFDRFLARLFFGTLWTGTILLFTYGFFTDL